MHIRALTKPVSAQSPEILLDILSQVLVILTGLEKFLGIDFSCKFFDTGCPSPPSPPG